MGEQQSHSATPKRLKQVLFGLLIGVLFLPVLQEWTGALREKPLAGVENVVDTVPLHDTTWLSGKFQANFELRHYRWMGLRPAMVRLHNQLDYSMFGEVFRSIMVGKDGELFRRGSMKAMRGLNYLGDEQIGQLVNKTVAVKQILEQQGTRFMVVFTPSKLRCMPDRLPGYTLPSRNPNNYDALIAGLQQQKVPVMDLHPFLTDKNQRFPYRIFPKTGTHWTDYGGLIGANRIFKRMERDEGKTYRAFRGVNFSPSLEMQDTDADAGDLLNLIRDLPPDTVHYQQLQFEQESAGLYRPKVLVIGDSFWWKIYNQDLHKNVFAPGSQYRYYNYEVFSDQWEGARYIYQFDLRQTLDGLDWVLICINEGNAHRYPFGFDDQVISQFYR